MVHQRHIGRTCGVGRRELPPCENPDTHRLEILWPDAVGLNDGLLARIVVDTDARLPGIPGKRYDDRGAHGYNTRRLRQATDHGIGYRICLIAAARWTVQPERRHELVILVETRIDVPDIAE